MVEVSTGKRPLAVYQLHLILATMISSTPSALKNIATSNKTSAINKCSMTCYEFYYNRNKEKKESQQFEPNIKHSEGYKA